ncbi:MAG: tRNA epoxyqueuosine(34) reductase QueG [Porphyromonadaceae bacterium]|nr:tRNA epoxyqueuosine(34) reductase QueG [Porphyromonadaceae bacterium]
MVHIQEERIKAEARRLGFAACGIAKANEVPNEIYGAYLEALKKGYHGKMSYLERNEYLRRDPRHLIANCRSIIMVVMNYYPKSFQDERQPQFAYYAYGRDYHRVVKKRLEMLLHFIRREIDPKVEGRAFSDSAPILERYWAEQAGLGWIGKNGLLIVPKAGSYFFIGSLLVSLSLNADTPLPNRCGSCTRCLEACPTGALIAPKLMDARRCISYLTIESPEDIPYDLAPHIGNRVYGCDDCQKACPWNRFSKGTLIEDFALRPGLSELSYQTIEEMTQRDFDTLFAGSAIRRISLFKLQANSRVARSNDPTSSE